jgi:hypothetical protein
MPILNGFELCEKVLILDLNIEVCFITAGEINQEAIRELYPLITRRMLYSKASGNRSFDQTAYFGVRIRQKAY